MRCQRHGLVVNNDGACPLCIRDSKRSAARGRVVVAVLFMAMNAAGLVMVVRWQLARFNTGESPVQSDRSITLPDGRVRLARAAATTTAGDPPETTAEEQLAGAEDGHLGKPLMQPPTLGVAPPAPPRAAVDPEPQAAEDPRDFELPAQEPTSRSAPPTPDTPPS